MYYCFYKFRIISASLVSYIYAKEQLRSLVLWNSCWWHNSVASWIHGNCISRSRWSLVWSWMCALKIVSHDIWQVTLLCNVWHRSQNWATENKKPLQTLRTVVHEWIIIYQLFCSIKKWDASIRKSSVGWLCIHSQKTFLCQSSFKAWEPSSAKLHEKCKIAFCICYLKSVILDAVFLHISNVLFMTS